MTFLVPSCQTKFTSYKHVKHHSSCPIRQFPSLRPMPLPEGHSSIGQVYTCKRHNKVIVLTSTVSTSSSREAQSKSVLPFHPSPAAAKTSPSSTEPTRTMGKGKQVSAPAPKKPSTARPAPAPSLPHPLLNARMSPYSLATDMLVDAVKAGMAAAPGPPGTAGQQGPGEAWWRAEREEEGGEGERMRRGSTNEINLFVDSFLEVARLYMTH
ncbi:hypothetical protein DFH08DRAFT_888264 [Mycena albidolilacea]|uniref:Uncharacterized protein n=1 Tax=Mycena albidolilacea TaxID=1033008 RepID=A0AAD6ZI41_9AGAR|nr:hypothetical protein DFH08DRAFT_888264 [Mycena albidolilacea]